MFMPFFLSWGVLGVGGWGALARDVVDLYVANTLSHTISVIDEANLKVKTTIRVTDAPFHLAFTLDGRRGYVTTPRGLLVLDAVRYKIVGHIRLSLSPFAQVHLSPQGNEAYVVTAGPPGRRNLERGTVLFVDLQRQRVRTRVGIGLNPLASVMTPDGRWLYVANWGSRDVSVINLRQRRLADSIPLDQQAGVRTLTISPQGGKVYAFQAERGRLWEIETGRNTVRAYPLRGWEAIYTAAVSPKGQRLYLHGRTKEGRYALVGLQVGTWHEVSRLEGMAFAAMTFSHDGRRLYLTGTPIDPERERELWRRYAPQLNRMQQASPSQRTKAFRQVEPELRRIRRAVTVVDLDTNRILATIPVGSLPQSSILNALEY